LINPPARKEGEVFTPLSMSNVYPFSYAWIVWMVSAGK